MPRVEDVPHLCSITHYVVNALYRHYFVACDLISIPCVRPGYRCNTNVEHQRKTEIVFYPLLGAITNNTNYQRRRNTFKIER